MTKQSLFTPSLWVTTQKGQSEERIPPETPILSIAELCNVLWHCRSYDSWSLLLFLGAAAWILVIDFVRFTVYVSSNPGWMTRTPWYDEQLSLFQYPLLTVMADTTEVHTKQDPCANKRAERDGSVPRELEIRIFCAFGASQAGDNCALVQ